MYVKYEEKTYENFFNSELDSKSKIFFPLGQVQEGILGMDSAARSLDRGLWRRIGFPFWFSPKFAGVDFREIANEMEDYLGEIVQNIPMMKVNLLLQYKRPEYIKSGRAHEWVYWKQPYFRYNIYKKQQALLDHLDIVFGQLALVLYVAPAIVDTSELVRYKKKNKIIACSNFKKSSELKGHNKNTYTRAGTHSIACSEPIRIENKSLVEILETPIKEHEFDNTEFIIETQSRIESLIRDNEIYRQPFEFQLEEISDLSGHEILYSFAVMKIFSDLTGIQWLISMK
jgi:hypothetical protein